MRGLTPASGRANSGGLLGRDDNARYQMPIAIDFSALSDGAIQAPLQGATWTISNGKAVNAPTLGSEMISNSEFTVNTTGLSAVNGATLTRRDYTSSPAIAPTGGVDDFGVEVQNNGAFGAAGSFAPGAVAGKWYRISARAYSPSGNTFVNAAGLLPTDGLVNTSALLTTNEDVWQSLVYTARASGTTPTIRLVIGGNTAGDKGHFDAVSVKELQAASLISYIPRSYPNAGIVKAAWTLATKAQAGVVGWWDGATPLQNCLVAIHDGTNAVLLKYVGATMTQLVSAAAAYAAGRVLEIRRTPGANTFQLFYNDVQIGADQTVNDVEIISNGYFGLFSTHSGNQAGSFGLNP